MKKSTLAIIFAISLVALIFGASYFLIDTIALQTLSRS